MGAIRTLTDFAMPGTNRFELLRVLGGATVEKFKAELNINSTNAQMIRCDRFFNYVRSR